MKRYGDESANGISCWIHVPSHYNASFNPWMDYRDEVYPQKAWSQWNALKKCLEDLGARVELMAPLEQSPPVICGARVRPLMLCDRRFLHLDMVVGVCEGA